MALPKPKSAKPTRERVWRAALASTKLADTLLAEIRLIQTRINSLSTALAGATPGTLPTNFTAGIIGETIDWNKSLPGLGHRQSLRSALYHALYSKELCDEILDSIEELQLVHDAVRIKLDAEAGILASTDWKETLGVEVSNMNKNIPGRAKSTYQVWLRTSLSSNKLADELIKWLVDSQTAMNGIIATLDAGQVNSGESTVVLDPQEKM